MPSSTKFIIPAIVILLSAAEYSITNAASFPSGSNSNTGTLGNPASSINSNINKNNNAPAADNVEQKEPNPILYENYQQCYAGLISDVVGKPAEVIDARKVTIKKYCKAISNAKYQKKFSECFNSSVNSGNDLDIIIKECVSSNDKYNK